MSKPPLVLVSPTSGRARRSPFKLTPAETQRIILSLQAEPKNLLELLQIVDIARNGYVYACVCDLVKLGVVDTVEHSEGVLYRWRGMNSKLPFQHDQT